MKVKTSITLSKDLLKAIDQFSTQYKNRSDFLEAAARALIAQLLRDAQNAKDLAILNRRADVLNREAADVLTYQGTL
jgi:metal-responsive CopG/Arc/MetJ family transcriptional regulator